jgi:hypothetical protein
MKLKQVTLAALAGSALLAAAPAFADHGRDGRQGFRGGQFQHRAVYVNQHAPRYYGHRPVFVHRPAVVQRPVVVVRDYRSHDVLGGLIVGAVLGAVIANHAGY